MLNRDCQLPGQADEGLRHRRKRVNAFTGIERATHLKLDRLEAAVELKDLAALPGKRFEALKGCLLYTSPSPRDLSTSRMPSSA